MRHNTMNTIRGRPYRSKMACTPAKALRLFSSFEKAGGFSAGGPEAGMATVAATGGGFWPITRESKTFKQDPSMTPSVAAFSQYLPKESPSPQWRLSRDERR